MAESEKPNVQEQDQTQSRYYSPALLPLIQSLLATLANMEFEFPAPHGWLRHPLSGRDPQEGDDDDRDNRTGWGWSWPGWAHVAPAQAGCSAAAPAR